MEGRKGKKQMQSPDREEGEEEKMEKFFAVIRSIRAAKDSWKDEPALKKMRTERQKAVWTPSFRWEDFMQGIELKSLQKGLPGPAYKNNDEADNKDNADESLHLKGLPAPNSEGNEEDNKGNEDDGLDLNLSL